MDTAKLEKMKAMKKFKRNHKAEKYLRYAYVAASAVVLSWSSAGIPVVLQTSALYFRFACTLVTSSRFIFVMCNVIILTLAAKSGYNDPRRGINTFRRTFLKESVGHITIPIYSSATKSLLMTSATKHKITNDNQVD